MKKGYWISLYIKVDDQESFIKHMEAQFVDMLRENFSDPNL